MRNASSPAANGGGGPPTLTAVAAPEPEDRPAADKASRSIRVTLGGEEYVMRVLFIAGNERWRAYEEKKSAEWVASLDASEDMDATLKSFAAQTDLQLDLLYAYDTDMGTKLGVLPPIDDLKERIFEDEPEAALAEVVKAANPKAAAAVERRRMLDLLTIASSMPTSTSPKPTAGRSRRSAKH
jgi:hypothetical protein